MSSRFNLLVLAVALVALVVSVWAATRPAPEPPGPLPAAPERRDDLESRFVGSQERMRAALEGSEADRRALADELRREISELEAAVDALRKELAATSPVGTPAKPAAEEGDLDRFRKLQAAARQEERRKKAAGRVDKAVKTAGLSLTDDQRTRLIKEWTAFEPRIDEIWGGVKRENAESATKVDWEVIITDTQRRIEREFTERISGFIPGEDAERVSANLTSWGK